MAERTELELDCVVIGAGVVGLAVARALQIAGRETFVIDRERSFGMQTSSRNSEVIHAGIYYKPGSLKAQHCVRGKALLYDYCAERSIPHRRIGKMILATRAEEEPAIERYMATASANGVDDLQPLEASDIAQLEPSVSGTAGLLSPSTGIIDSHHLMQSLLGDLEDAGGNFVRQCGFIDGELSGNGIALRLSDGTHILARTVINSAGLFAPDVAGALHGFGADYCPTAYYARGHYYSMTGRSPFNRLVYPVAQPGGLGVHVTLDLAGQAKFGPDVRWSETIDYNFDDSRKDRFVDAIRAYFPGIDASQLAPAYVGIRPKIVPPEAADQDFLLQGPEQHGVPGLINLFGIESPGLTCSLSIAQTVADMVAADI